MEARDWPPLPLPPPMPQVPPPRSGVPEPPIGPFMARRALAKHLGVRARGLDLVRSEDGFPLAFQLRPNVLVWDWSEVAAWLLTRPRVARSAPQSAKRKAS